MTINPDRATVERIIREEAEAVGVAADKVIHAHKSPSAVHARRRAIWRIVHETGCSARGLSRLWGLDNHVVSDSLKAEPQLRPRAGRTAPSALVYYAGTADRLAWQYGAERAAEIVAGRDPATNADLAAWRWLCA